MAASKAGDMKAKEKQMNAAMADKAAAAGKKPVQGSVSKATGMPPAIMRKPRAMPPGMGMTKGPGMKMQPATPRGGIQKRRR